MGACRVPSQLDRRGFLKSAAGAGAALALGPAVFRELRAGESKDVINVALIGAGEQGKVLMEATRRIAGVRFQAVCDIWPYNRKWVAGRLRAHRHGFNAYEDYREMLDQEKDLHAAIIATPDFWHDRHTVACLEAGLHVYCEKAMSNTVAGARRMVETARRTGKLLQIGHQRRSNPRYLFCLEKLLKEVQLFGRITAVNGQWNRSVHEPAGWPKGTELDETTLKRYGYESMHQLRNWRWYKGLGGGPIVDLGSHQIDIYNWFLGARPASVLASGRLNYYDRETHHWHDTVMAVYEYDTPQGPVTASYQTLSANGNQAYFEKFMGDRGTLILSERSDLTRLHPEPTGGPAIAWAKCVRNGYLTAGPEWMKLVERMSLEELAGALSVTGTLNSTGRTPTLELAVEMHKLIHQPHLENFFDAIRGRAKLTCPAEVGYETAVTVLKVNEAAEAGRRLEFTPEEFVV